MRVSTSPAIKVNIPNDLLGKTFCVGGAIRDRLMGLVPQDFDFVVVGATPELMLRLGFRAVGKDFPVFLHPQTQQEFALARTERKIGAGYSGFSVHFAPDVTLDEDLARRDLTINAMAQLVLPNGELSTEVIDPYNGQDDLQHHVFRHISPAFSEDPVRILRISRFHARWPEFTVADETMMLMKNMVAQGETSALVPDRVWQEFSRGLMENHPSAMINTLRQCGLLHQWLPEVDALFGVPQRADYHPEIDTGIHLNMVLDQAAAMNLNLESRFGALCHDLGKGNTPADILPRHTAHEERGVPLTEALAERIKATKACKEYGMVISKHHTSFYYLPVLQPATVIDILQRCDAIRRPERFKDLLKVSLADKKGRGGDFPNQPNPWYDAWLELQKKASDIDAAQISESCRHDPAAIPETIRLARIDQIRDFLKNWQSEHPEK